MKSIFRILAFSAVALGFFASCKEEERNTEPLVDPWTRERTPVNIRLESQIGAAVITDNWREPEQGTVHVSLITSTIDLAAVKVVAVDFKFPDSEFCPKCSIKAGDTVDLTSGTTSFVVTAYSGETRTYELSYEVFSDPLVGVYGHELLPGILDASNAPASSMFVGGGWTDAYVLSSAMDKYWQWDADPSKPAAEYDNKISFMLTDADAETGLTRGTIVNTAGEDGAYADYMFQGSSDVSAWYRIIPQGSSRWAKNEAGDIVIYAKEDENYENPLYIVKTIGAGDFTPSNVPVDRVISIPNLAFARYFEVENEVVDYNWPDSRWMRDNIRFTAWTMQKTSEEPLADHADLF